MISIPTAVLIAIVTGIASGVGHWAAMRVHLRWLRRDVDLAHERITNHERIFHGQAKE